MTTPVPRLDLRLRARRHLWQPFAPPPNPESQDGPTVFVRGEGVWLEDSGGRRYLDGIGALEAMAVGHGRTRLADVAAAQMKELAFLDVFRHTSIPAIELADELVRLSPSNLNRVFLTPGGSEAVETALKLAFQYHYLRGEGQRRTVLVRRGAFHGVTFGAMNCDGGYYTTRNDVYLQDCRFGVVADGEVTADGWGSGKRHASGAENFAAKIMELGPDSIAAVIVDPVATASGVAAPPASDLQELRRLCDEHGVLLIVDEVITGFARTGRMFASLLYEVEPDFMTLSKALSSGYLPIGATLIADRVVSTFETAADDAVFAHGHTFGGHPVACAVAMENIRIIEEEHLAARAAEMGRYLREQLESLSGHRSYVDARGVGMLTGLEITGEDDASRSFATAGGVGVWLRKRCLDLGLITLTVHPGTVLLLAPPLIISESEVDTLVGILDQALDDLDQAVSRAS